MTSSDELLRRVREVCFGFPAVEEKVSHGAPCFHVRGKLFLTFADDHHGDREVAAWVKVSPGRQAELVAESPERYFVPPYVGPKGWIGVWLDHRDMDWDELVILVEDGWTSVAPRSAMSAPVRPPPVAPARPKTDPAVAAAARARVDALARARAGVEVEGEKWSTTYRVGKTPFAYFVDNHHGDGIVAAWLRAAPGENERLAASAPDRYFVPPYMGPKGWVGVRLDRPTTDWGEVAERVAASHAAAGAKAATAKATKAPAAKRASAAKTASAKTASAKTAASKATTRGRQPSRSK